MKTWTNPSVEELEVEMTAGGIPLSWYESGWLPGIWGDNDNNNPNPNPNPNPEPGDGTDEPGRDETTDGQS